MRASTCAPGAPTSGLDLGTVHITNLFGRGDRTQAGVTHHHGESRVGDVSRWEDFWITAPGRTAVDTAAGVDLVTAVSVLDWTLNQERTTGTSWSDTCTRTLLAHDGGASCGLRAL